MYFYLPGAFDELEGMFVSVAIGALVALEDDGDGELLLAGVSLGTFALVICGGIETCTELFVSPKYPARIIKINPNNPALKTSPFPDASGTEGV